MVQLNDFMEGSRRSGSLTTLDCTTRRCSMSDGQRMSKEKTAYDINGYTFYMEAKDMDSDDQNSGVTMECMTGSDNGATE